VADAASLAPLPRGRHSLTREEVATAQKLRLAVATAEAMAEKGYVGTPVADILRRAGVSRQSFYEHYRDKHECFLDALDLAGSVLATELVEEIAGPGEPLARAQRALDRYLRTIAAEPAFARLYLVEVHAAGEEAMRRRADLQAALADGLADLLGLRRAKGRFACQAFVAAVAGLVSVPLVAGDTDAVLALRRPIRQLLADLVAGPLAPSR